MWSETTRAAFKRDEAVRRSISTDLSIFNKDDDLSDRDDSALTKLSRQAIRQEDPGVDST